MKIKELCNEWIETYHKDNIKKQTYLKYLCIINNYINPIIGDKRIKSLSRRDIQSFINILKTTKGKRTKKQLSPEIINETLSVLKLAFGYAVDFDIITFDPTIRIKGVKKQYNNKVKCFTIEEQKRIE